MRMQLDIDNHLYRQLSRRAKKKGFESAEEYSIIILETVIDELETKHQQDKVQDRLEDLGYLE